MQEMLDKLGWSQAYFAGRMGVSANTVSAWCNGEPNQAAMVYLELVCRLLGV